MENQKRIRIFLIGVLSILLIGLLIYGKGMIWDRQEEDRKTTENTEDKSDSSNMSNERDTEDMKENSENIDVEISSELIYPEQQPEKGIELPADIIDEEDHPSSASSAEEHESSSDTTEKEETSDERGDLGEVELPPDKIG